MDFLHNLEFIFREVEEGKEVSADKPKPIPVNPEPTQAASKSSVVSAKASFTSPLARFSSNKPTEPPPLFEFSVVHPVGLSELDMDVMRLTAQFTAVNGRDFLAGLAQREQRNPQFDFLKPTHMLFSYFTSLVDAYCKILAPSKEIKTRVGNFSFWSAYLTYYSTLFMA